jgi:site-specific DNA recombinase
MNGPAIKLARCAIYTRKSTEHNLDLAFNSLDAQREACEAYIKSQSHEGWRLIPGRYDDGAFSGASLDRPALQMGRLTLNVLLSFAQFEREVIGERVRDKIAASKRRGMWVGGPVPLGYAAVDKKICVVPAEAEAVRTIFARYLELGSVRALAADIGRRGIRSKLRRLSDGRTVGGGS